MFSICLEVEEGGVLLVLESDHAWEVLTAVIFTLEAYNVTTKQTQRIHLHLLLTIPALLRIILLLKSNKIVRQLNQIKAIERRQHQ